MKDPQIYVDAYQLALSIFHRTKSFSKQIRPSLGRRLEESALTLLITSKKAMFSQSDFKVKHLYTLSDMLDEIRILAQLSFDLEMLSTGGFNELSELTNELGREVGGLLKHEKTRQSVE